MLTSQLLISFQSNDELPLAEGLHVRWLDLKNPSKGSLGSPDRQTAIDFAETAGQLFDRSECQVSIALGELVESNWSTLLPFAEPYDFVKIGLAGCRKNADWKSKAVSLANSLGGTDRLILVHYADAPLADAPDWESTLAAADRLRSRYLLIDTCHKSSGRLFDWLTPSRIRQMACQAADKGIELAIAGSLRIEELPAARSLGASVIGIRGAACRDGSRVDGLCRDRLIALSELFMDDAAAKGR